MKSLVLVLGGGGAKGYAHIGVIKALEQVNIIPDLIIGTSMGALIGAIYSIGKDISHIEELVSSFNSIGNFSLVSTIFKGNFLNVKKVNKILNENFDGIKQEETKIPFVCVATNMRTGKAKVFTSGELKNNVLASISIPGIFPTVKMDNDEYCDGGLINNLPEDVARQMMPDAIIVSVDVIGEYSKQVEHHKFKTMQNLINSIQIMTQNNVYSKPIYADERIEISLPNVSILNFSSELAKKTIRRGLTITKKYLPKIQDLLGVTNENIRRNQTKSKS